METFRLEAEDGTSTACFRRAVNTEPRGVVVVAHGMGEHARRYARLADSLAEHRIEAFALDHRGHGDTAPDASQLGVLGNAGWPAVISDYARLVAHARATRPGVPVIAFGHSMGSFVVQEYLLDHSVDVVAAVLSGSAALDEVKALVDPSAPLDLTALNGPFVPARTDYDWLSRDEAEVDAYVDDPRCGFGLDPAALTSWLVSADRLADEGALGAIRSGFPIYLVAGGDDPVNAGYAWLETLAVRYEKVGLSVTRAYYDGARHEVFNETNRDEITADLITWLEREAVDDAKRDG